MILFGGLTATGVAGDVWVLTNVHSAGAIVPVYGVQLLNIFDELAGRELSSSEAHTLAQQFLAPGFDSLTDLWHGQLAPLLGIRTHPITGLEDAFSAQPAWHLAGERLIDSFSIGH